MAEGGEDKENEARKKMQQATAKLFERREKDGEVIDAEGSRIAMPSLSHKWQTIIDDTLIPQIESRSAVRKRSRSITPDEEEKKRRPLSMPNASSPLPLELYDATDGDIEPPVEVELPRGAIGDTPRRKPARLEPIDVPPPPPSYDEALSIGPKEGPRSLPFYGRLWQMGQTWSKEADQGKGLRARPEAMGVIEPHVDNGDTVVYSGSRPLPPIGTRAEDMKETSFAELGNIRSRSSLSEAYDPANRDVVDAEEGRDKGSDRFECDNCFGSRFPRVVRYLNSLTTTKLIVLVVALLGIIGLVLFLGLFPASFVYVEYHEMALLKNKVTGSVDRDTVYYTGCYVLGPDKEFITYPISANTISQTTEVFTVDRLSISISYYLQYYIRGSELGELHREYELEYDGILQTVITSEIKNNVGQFNLDYFRLNRTQLETFILNLLKRRLQGNCCQDCCPSGCTNNTACTICQPAVKCNPGYHVDIKYFQLSKIVIPNLVSDLFIKQLTLQVEAEKEYLVQDYTVVQKQTTQMTQKIKNEAEQILEAAKADAAKTLVLAESEREANITSAYVFGLQYTYLTLGVVSEDHKTSLMMLRAMDDLNQKGLLYKSYGYNTSTIIGSG